ncbi:DUF1572 family protein [Deinococcus wulumuqiensis]|uniref:DUF1572 domain-containing protein n=1 Tax=Deinococcus wulumuqiensis TaxID=980427 RepID=A0AAV4JZJ8_9DEIO|nr:DUF1572 family protein [Deinococcus wulumuqiensis]QII19626.1 DUF1572 family protein [Deinococcus wulumuqiensis R12]GGI70268.1 hypothetical protein GCM10010914_00460 [Deinococcus wulumuqiensis]GGP29567.1 hypothetical protein GCM10008021_12180 [Deinococcus wulumuqiensis]
MDLGTLYLSEVRERLRGTKQLGDRALAQLPEEHWHTVLAPEGNSVAVIVQHLAGNLRSRWGGLLGGYREGVEGESPTRDRDAEFEDAQLSPAELIARWDDGWQVFLDALDHLRPDDLTQTLTIRGEAHTVLGAVERAALHASGHVFQLVFLVKTLRGEEFQSLSIPRGASAVFNAQMLRRA